LKFGLNFWHGLQSCAPAVAASNGTSAIVTTATRSEWRIRIGV